MTKELFISKYCSQIKLNDEIRRKRAKFKRKQQEDNSKNLRNKSLMSIRVMPNKELPKTSQWKMLLERTEVNKKYNINVDQNRRLNMAKKLREYSKRAKRTESTDSVCSVDSIDWIAKKVDESEERKTSDTLSQSKIDSTTSVGKNEHREIPICSLCHHYDIGCLILPCDCKQSRPVHFHCLKPVILNTKNLHCIFCNKKYRCFKVIYDSLPNSKALTESFILFMMLFVLLIFKYMFFVAHDYEQYIRSFLWFLFGISLVFVYMYVALRIYIYLYNSRNRKIVDLYIDPNALVEKV